MFKDAGKFDQNIGRQVRFPNARNAAYMFENATRLGYRNGYNLQSVQFVLAGGTSPDSGDFTASYILKGGIDGPPSADVKLVGFVRYSNDKRVLPRFQKNNGWTWLTFFTKARDYLHIEDLSLIHISEPTRPY